MRRRMWEDDVTHLLAAAASPNIKGNLTDYEPPSERLADALAEAGVTPEQRQQERHLRLLQLSELGVGDVGVA